MTISNYTEAFVWIWLPSTTEPVVAGKLTRQGSSLIFSYSQSYLARDNVISIFDPELPLKSGALPLLPGMHIPSCLRDAAPDAWGRRVIINKLLGRQGKNADVTQLDELTYLLESGSDRIGALDFQASPTVYEPRSVVNTSLEELLEATECVLRGQQLSPELYAALNHGTSIGGARPKALVEDHNIQYIAKFSASTDLYAVVKAEFIAMRLGSLCGLNVATVSLTQAANKDVLLIERFDRVDEQRKCLVSALTLLELDEMMARYASYENLAEIIRYRFTNASATLRELFGRITFNILTGNTDDHARNHAAFWDGQMLTLTPAYDLCPQNRTGNEASQAMLIAGNNRLSKLSVCLDAAHIYMLSEKEALAIIEKQLLTIGTQWRSLCEQTKLSEIDQKLMFGRQFLNHFAFDDLTGNRAYLKEMANDLRGF